MTKQPSISNGKQLLLHKPREGGNIAKSSQFREDTTRLAFLLNNGPLHTVGGRNKNHPRERNKEFI